MEAVVQAEQGRSETVFPDAALMRLEEDPMKKLLILAAAASLVATMANAQTTVITPDTTTGTAGATIRIEPEYRTKIKSYVTEHKIRPVETRERIVVGAKVPTEVELEAVPSDWGPTVTKYRYVYSDNRVMLVDPATRTVVHEID
ncbi:hypothetical protein V1292_004218 [Bradyrhizobium sp. AZCC 1719]|uniref:DUF1236 domain-containing protein n=1 Tax=Bradyrhizobium sp. AZCC 1719 TaxID=3117028 RepID=UPI002FF101AC